MKVCRVCLAMGVKMFHMSEYNLSVVFERVTGVELNMEDNLPKMLCWECFARLSSAYKFMKKALKTHLILENKMRSGGVITMSDIEFIDKTQFNSTLGVKFYRGDSSYIHIIENGNCYEDSKAEFNESNYEDINNVEEHNFDTQDIVSAERDPIKREYSDVTEEVKVEDEYNTEADISNESDEYQFQNTDFKSKTIENISNENATDAELVIDIESNASRMSVEEIHIMGETTETYDISKQNWKRKKSEALPHCKELRVVLEDVMLTMEKLKTQDSFKYLKDNAQYAKDDNGTFSVGNSSISDPVSVLTGFSDAVSSNKLYDKSLRNDNHTNVFTCDYCTFETSVKKRLTYHTKTKHLKSSFNCAHCDFVTNVKCTLIRHINTKHTKSILFKCSFCNHETYNKGSLTNHVNNKHTKTNVFKCSFCNYETYYKYSLAKHVNNKHTKTNVFKCSFCNYETYYKYSLAKHVNKKHTKTNVFKCSFCNHETYDKHSLAKHVNVKHTKSDVFKCSFCNYELYDKKSLNSHFNAKHNKTHVFKCSFCNHKTYDKRSLTRHVNAKHTKTKVFKCSFCNHKTYDNFSLTKHVNAKHTKTNVFKCSFCNYETYDKRTLKEHINGKHTRVNVFICSYCNLQVYYKSNLIRHITKKHS